MAYKCPECGADYVGPTICAGSPVVDGAITDYKKPLHEPVGVGYVKREYTITDGRGNVTVSEEWVLESDAAPEVAPDSEGSGDVDVPVPAVV
jgi:hypothetical protein